MHHLVGRERTKKAWVGLLDYPVVVATLAVGVLGGALELIGMPLAARGVISAFAVVVALTQARGMIGDLRSGRYGIDLLAVTAIGSTVAVGEYWAALVVCLMLAGGEALEEYAEHRARREVTGLLERAPRNAHRCDKDGEIGDVDVGDVDVGDMLLVRPFEVLPVDAVLESDGASLDESSLTGESLPVDRTRGEEVLSGALNGGDAITIRATATAADSQYQRIIDLVREAQGSRAPFVRLADRVAVPFTVGALTLAVGAWIVTGEAVRLAEVLVVATPCPLIIAAPVAFMAGMSRSARGGVIVKSGGTLEQLAAVRTIAVDKTGTLTRGEPRVTQVRAGAGFTPEEVLTLAAAVERYSTHPLAEAIVAAARAARGQVASARDVTEVPAHGVRGQVAGRRVVAGRASFVAETVGTEPRAPTRGHTGVHVAVDGYYAGCVELADELRAESRATIAALHRAGMTTMMLTGDDAHVAGHIAAQVGIEDVRAELLPQDKVAAVTAASRRPVLMVGDGVNDAPVLAAADVGIAMGARGSSAASESADVVIMLDDLSRTVRAVQIGRRTMRVAWQAIGIGVALSVGLMLVAAVGMLPAVVGAGLQEVVDVACILWALLAMRPGRAERAELERMEAEMEPRPAPRDERRLPTSACAVPGTAGRDN